MKFKTRVISLLTDVKKANLESVKKLINYCNKYNLSPLFVVHPLKKDIIQYLGKESHSFLVYQPRKDDNDFKIALLTEEDWFDNNILILPNHSFKPHRVLNEMKVHLEVGASTVFGIKAVDDIINYNVVMDYYSINNTSKHDAGYMWGILGFGKIEGKGILNSFSQKNVAHSLYASSFVLLDEFVE